MEFGESIYFCKRKKGKVEKYEAPEEIVLRRFHFSLMTTKGLMNTLKYGKDVDNTYIALAPIKEWGRDYFHEGDKFYLDYAKPSSEEENGETANAKIKSVKFQNMFIRLVIEKTVENQVEF